MADPAPASLVVAGSHSPSASLLPSLLAKFEKSHPNVQLDLRTDNRLAVEAMVLKGEADLAVFNNPPVKPPTHDGALS